MFLSRSNGFSILALCILAVIIFAGGAHAHDSQKCGREFGRLMRFFDKSDRARAKMKRDARELVQSYKRNIHRSKGRVFRATELFLGLSGNLNEEPDPSKCLICDGNLTTLGQRIRTITSLRKGDTLIAESGEKLMLGDYRGAGNSKHIFAIANKPGFVVYIPRAALRGTAFERWNRAFGTMWYGFKSSEKIEEEEVPLLPQKKDGEIGIAEDIQPFFKLDEFMRKIKNKRVLTAEENKKVEEVGKFIAKFRGKAGFGDIFPEQIVWHPSLEIWMAADYTNYMGDHPQNNEFHLAYQDTISAIGNGLGRHWNRAALQIGSIAYTPAIPLFPEAQRLEAQRAWANQVRGFAP